MSNNITLTGRCEAGSVQRVQRFFDEPQNYLARSRANIRVRTETVADFLTDRHFTTILDVGCGDGSVSLPLLSPLHKLTLLDVSPNMLASAQSRVPQNLRANVELINGDFLTTSLGSECYDIVICIGVLAHVSSPHDLVVKIATVLKPGGMLVLQCTDASHFSRRFISFYHRCLTLFRPGLYRAGSLTNRQVLEMIAKLGFRPTAGFCYGSGLLPGLHRVFSQETLYQMSRKMYGDVARNQNQWLGCEHIYALVRD